MYRYYYQGRYGGVEKGVFADYEEAREYILRVTRGWRTRLFDHSDGSLTILFDDLDQVTIY